MDNEKIVVLGRLKVYENGFEELGVHIYPHKYYSLQKFLKLCKELENSKKVEKTLNKIKALPYSNPRSKTYNLNKFLSNCETVEEERKVLRITHKFRIAGNGDFEVTEGDFFFESAKKLDCRGILSSLNDDKMLNFKHFNLDVDEKITVYILRDKSLFFSDERGPELFTIETNILMKILERWKEILSKYENGVDFRKKERSKGLLENIEKYSFSSGSLSSED